MEWSPGRKEEAASERDFLRFACRSFRMSNKELASGDVDVENVDRGERIRTSDPLVPN
jgi:hypothetical protein